VILLTKTFYRFLLSLQHAQALKRFSGILFFTWNKKFEKKKKNKILCVCPEAFFRNISLEMHTEFLKYKQKILPSESHSHKRLVNRCSLFMLTRSLAKNTP
jgi:hypothetical protein